MKYLKYCTINKRSKGMLEVSKVVFVAFTQHCIQSNVTHVGVEGAKYFTEQNIKNAMPEVLKVYSIYSGLSPLLGGKEGSSFVNFLGLVKLQRVIAGKVHSQSPILKTKGCSATW